MRILFTTILCFVLSANMQAQMLPAAIDEVSLKFKVKQIDEFMSRFNGDISYDGSKSDRNMTIDERLANMYTVFRLKNFGFDTKTRQPNKLMTDFCQYIITNNLRLKYENDNWMAEVICNAKMGNQKCKLSLFLQTEHIRDVLYKWVLVDVGADFMPSQDSVSQDSLFISPAEHGISFITLPRIINLSVADVNTVFKKNWKPDRLSVFNYLICNKKLALTSVDKVIYHWTLSKYTFDVERFEGENTPNQGWLVSKIFKNK